MGLEMELKMRKRIPDASVDMGLSRAFGVRCLLV